MEITNSDHFFLSKIRIFFTTVCTILCLPALNFSFFHSVQSQSTLLSYAILQSTFIFAAVNNSVFIRELCPLLLTRSPCQWQACQTAQAAAWITMALQGLTSVQKHCLPLFCFQCLSSYLSKGRPSPLSHDRRFSVLSFWWRI